MLTPRWDNSSKWRDGITWEKWRKNHKKWWKQLNNPGKWWEKPWKMMEKKLEHDGNKLENDGEHMEKIWKIMEHEFEWNIFENTWRYPNKTTALAVLRSLFWDHLRSKCSSNFIILQPLREETVLRSHTSSQRGVIQWSFMILLPSFTYHYPLQYNTVSTPTETMADLVEFLANVVEPQKRFDWQSFISSTQRIIEDGPSKTQQSW